MTRDEALTVANLERDTLIALREVAELARRWHALGQQTGRIAGDRLVAAKIAIESATVSAAFLAAEAARELGESIPF